MQACETQLKLLPVGLDNLNLIPEETRKAIFDASRRPPEGYEVKSHKHQDQTDSNKDGPRSQVFFDENSIKIRLNAPILTRNLLTVSGSEMACW